jgi:uroporphyrin-III C-methyltransferase/precorrin-2 dehydrogenase/sirohydrochlorin ferrochelatase
VTQPLYPVGLRLDGRRVLVVGGGTVASRRVPALLDAGADVLLVAPEVTPALHALIDAGRIGWLPRRFQPSDVDGAWLVQAAVDDPAAAREVSAAAEAARVFCVRADDRHAATAWTPAVTRHGPVTVAVIVSSHLGEISKAALDRGGDPRRAMAVRDGIRDRLADGSLDAGPSTVEPGVALVGAGPGDPELITVKGRRLLALADVVVVDHLAPGLLLDEVRPDVEVVDASKIPYGPARTQEEINRVLVDRAKAGKFVLRLKGGDPYVFGRGGEELRACVEAGVPVTVVPGVTSAVAAPAAVGIPVTQRGVAHEFVVVSGHLPPGDPGSLVNWPALAAMTGTVCVLMGLRHLPAIVAALLAGGRSPDTPAAAVQDGTTGAQRVVRAPLSGLVDAVTAAGVRSPAVVVIGEVVTAI